MKQHDKLRRFHGRAIKMRKLKKSGGRVDAKTETYALALIEESAGVIEEMSLLLSEARATLLQAAASVEDATEPQTKAWLAWHSKWAQRVEAATREKPEENHDE